MNASHPGAGRGIAPGRRRAVPATLLAWLLLAALWPARGLAQNPPPLPAAVKEANPGAFSTEIVAEAPVESLYVEGLLRVDSSMVVRKLGLKPGDRFQPGKAREGLQALADVGYFASAELVADSLDDGGLVLTLRVEERPTVSSVEFQGNKELSADKLKTAVKLTVGQWADSAAVAAEAQRLKDYYRDEGFANAKVTGRLSPPGSATPAALFDIQEGSKVKIDEVRFTGSHLFDPRALRKQMQSKARGFLRSGTYKPDELDDDAGRIASYYRDHGYREVVVSQPRIDYDSTGKLITVTFAIQDGPLEYFGNTDFTGSIAIADSNLKRMVLHHSGAPYSEALVRKTLEGVYAAYQELGYIFVDVDPQMGSHDSLVDLHYVVNEGRQAHLREVKVTGNEHTQEKVVRREVVMHTGDVFRRSLVQRSQRDIFQLGIFSDVQIDYQPSPDSTAPGDVDLTFKLTEKQTGTASMGAGYSSTTGLTGFADLGHKNIFGGAQTINLHLERGDVSSNYDLSYTEPYWKDTPTSVGFDLFDTDQNRNNTTLSSIASYYDERRKGASISVGRPLGFIDYSRLSVTYRLEDVTLSNFADSMECSDGFLHCPTDSMVPVYPYVHALAIQHYPQLTSSLSIGFSRNSTNSPFYPTRGSNLSLSLGINGGPLGGDVTFNKYVIDLKHYTHVLGPFTLMNRHRLSVLAGSDSAGGVPLYERFRMGGTSQDYLRGYPDYSVVPDGNDLTRGGTIAWTNTFEFEFPVADPVHAVFFTDLGNTWNTWEDFKKTPLSFLNSLGLGIRTEIPILGPIGFDFAYGFKVIKNSDGSTRAGGKWVPHLLFGTQF